MKIPETRKADCCWNCFHAIRTIDYDEPYTLRCCLHADKEVSKPEMDYEEYDEYFVETAKWEHDRPDVDYGGICDYFIMGDNEHKQPSVTPLWESDSDEE